MFLRYMPDSHNSRSFLSRMLAPGGWSSQIWATVLLGLCVSLGWLAYASATLARRTPDTFTTVNVHLEEVRTRQSCRARSCEPEQLLLVPSDSALRFELDKPFARVLEAPYPDPSVEITIGYYRSDCETRGGDATVPRRLVCRPALLRMGGFDRLTPRRFARESRKSVVYSLMCLGAFLAFSVVAIRKRW